MIYTPSDAEKNAWFIGRMQQEGAKRGHALHLYLAADPSCRPDFSGMDFCLNRSRFSSISACAQTQGCVSINNEKTIRIANDKWATYELLRHLSLPCMDTFLPRNEPNYPFVVKSLSGHGGSEVFLAESPEAYESIKNQLQKKPYLLQALCSETGVDVRAYVMGEQLMAAVKRTSDTDFRSNYSLGGQVALFEPTKEQMHCIRRLQNALGSDYIGIDFILHQGQWVVNEIEDAAGARMLYSLTDIDFISLYWDQIEKRLKEGTNNG